MRLAGNPRRAVQRRKRVPAEAPRDEWIRDISPEQIVLSDNSESEEPFHGNSVDLPEQLSDDDNVEVGNDGGDRGSDRDCNSGSDNERDVRDGSVATRANSSTQITTSAHEAIFTARTTVTASRARREAPAVTITMTATATLPAGATTLPVTTTVATAATATLPAATTTLPVATAAVALALSVAMAATATLPDAAASALAMMERMRRRCRLWRRHFRSRRRRRQQWLQLPTSSLTLGRTEVTSGLVFTQSSADDLTAD